jgi:AbrB family looped-hinge helix DNA binding protein
MEVVKRRRSQRGRKVPALSVHEGSASYSVPEREIVTIDRSGRLVLPKKIRNSFDTDRFEVRTTESVIELVPVKSLRSLLGALPDLDIDTIYKEHDEDVEEEEAE